MSEKHSKNLNRLGMFGWWDDIPVDSKNIFINVLEMLRTIPSPKILEIGTYTGVSIMGIKNTLPNSICYAIDNWGLKESELQLCRDISDIQTLTMGDVRKTFLENTENQDITLIENDSSKALIDLHRQNMIFDFIYVDGSHTMLDSYVDLILSWSLLSSNGILAIDDVLWRNGSNDRPKESVDIFLKRYRDQYLILSSDYRVFLQKI
jgi:predicted O-methyltransferase YrrM